MKTNPWLILLATVLLMMPSSIIMAQDQDEPNNEPILEYDLENESEFLPILETASEYGSLETFLNILSQAGLDEKLLGEGPFTLFAPDDSAFTILKSEQLEKLKSDKDYLKMVMARHIVVGQEIEFGDEPQSMEIQTLNGDNISVKITEVSVQIEQGIVIDEEIGCSNGVIHVIDAVLIPSKGKRED
ncbi:MAG: fasciclin domain-containing protein [Candidatus Zixiibacteriota bacterium]